MGVDNRALIAEFIGTFGLIFMGGGAIILGGGAGIGLVGVALAHGLAIFLGVSFSAHISGGHLNPAVTAGFMFTKRMETNVGVAYIVSQLLGGILAAVFLRLLVPSQAATNTRLGTPGPGAAAGPLTVLLGEMILTFFLVFVIFATAVDPKSSAKAIFPLCIGMAVTMDILAGAPLTGASMNPARSFGPALVALLTGIPGAFRVHWAYWIGPILGGCAAAWVYDNMLMEKK